MHSWVHWVAETRWTQLAAFSSPLFVTNSIFAVGLPKKEKNHLEKAMKSAEESASYWSSGKIVCCCGVHSNACSSVFSGFLQLNRHHCVLYLNRWTAADATSHDSWTPSSCIRIEKGIMHRRIAEADTTEIDSTNRFKATWCGWVVGYNATPQLTTTRVQALHWNGIRNAKSFAFHARCVSNGNLVWFTFTYRLWFVMVRRTPANFHTV